MDLNGRHAAMSPSPVRLTAGRARLDVDPADGGRWTSLSVDGLELLTGVALPDGHPPTLHGCFAMAPFAGRLHQARLEWQGETHLLPAHAAPHALHGTAVDAAWSVRDATATTAVVEHQLAAPWPFRGRVRQELSLFDDRLETALVVEADEPMPVVVGWHPWFRRRLARGGQVDLDLQPAQMYERGPDGLPTGQLVTPPPGPYDDCFLGMGAPPRLTWPGALELVLDSPTDHWVVFTERPEAVCVEPQTGPPDAVRLGRATVVPAGGSHELRLVLRWRRLPADRP